MSSYVITGASRGLGFEFMRQLSENQSSTIIGLVRNKDATVKKVASELDRPNIHIVQADITDFKSLKKSVEEVAKITGGSLDYLIANAALMSEWSAFNPIGELAKEPERLVEDLNENFQVNVVANIQLYNVFLPLILKGRAKKVIALTTGLADIDFTANFDIASNVPYSISKAAMNMVVAKFSAQYRKDGVLFMGISPGLVATHDYSGAPEEALDGVQQMLKQFAEYAPGFTGPITPAESVKQVLQVIERASVEKGDGGSFVSHYGNKQWL